MATIPLAGEATPRQLDFIQELLAENAVSFTVPAGLSKQQAVRSSRS